MSTALIYADKKTHNKLKVIAALQHRTLKNLLEEFATDLWRDHNMQQLSKIYSAKADSGELYGK